MSPHRIADMQLRGNTSPVPVRVYWPGQPAWHRVPLLVFCIVGAGAEAACRTLSEDAGLVVLAVRCDPAGPHDGLNVLDWAADHAAELGADPARLLIGGEGAGAAVAAAVARQAQARRWPPVARQVLVNTSPVPFRTIMKTAPATVVTVSGHPGGDQGRYAARLREAGVEVDELRIRGDPWPPAAMNIRGHHRPISE